MNAKSESHETPYLIEDAPKQSWLKSKSAKLTAVIVGGVLALGLAFGAGLAVGSHEGGESDRGNFGFNHDGPNGQHPPRPGDGDSDGNH